MADWIYKNDVRFNSLYRRLPNIHNEYILFFDIPNEKSIFTDSYKISIDNYDFEKQLIEFSNGDRDRCYFTFGMQDIDFYQMKNGKIGITHSPHDGLNIQLVLVDGEFEELINCFKTL